MEGQPPKTGDSVKEWRAKDRYHRDPNVQTEEVVSDYFIDPKNIPASLSKSVIHEQEPPRPPHEYTDDEFGPS